MIRVFLGFVLLGTVYCYSLDVGQKVEDFSLPGTDGKTYSLHETLKHKKLAAVIFVATNCPVSKDYEDRYVTLFNTFNSKYKGQVALLPINSNDSESASEVKTHARKFPFAVLKDEGNKIADQFKAEKTPEVYLIDQKQMIVYHGAIDNDRALTKTDRTEHLLVAVDEALNGSVKVATTKAFGCSIKRK